MSFTLYPAIDLKDGACVRLRRGEMAEATIYSTDAASQALAWQEAGATWLHVVDLNGAFAGRAVNASAVQAILQVVSIPVQLGGGIRSLDAIESWFAGGVSRVILGSAAVRTPALMGEAAREFPGRVAIGIDARNGMVATNGWSETTSLPAVELARRAEQAGVAAIIYTDIARDGMLTGVNIAETRDIADAVHLPVIASGGIGGPGDLRALADAAFQSAGRIAGVIVGRALYDGRLDLRAALAMLRAGEEAEHRT